MMNDIYKTQFHSAICRVTIILALAAPVSLAAETNPWTELRVGPEETRQMSSDRNTWRNGSLDQGQDAVDSGKYPPMDEDRALNIGIYGNPPEPQATAETPAVTTVPEPERQTTYPAYPPADYSRGYANRGYPAYGYGGGPRGNYRHQPWGGGYRPGGGYGGFWPGSGSSGMFPFGGRGGNFPFGGSPFWGGSSFW